MLRDMFYSVDVYREVEREDDWANMTETDNWQYSHQVSGFIQPRSANYGQVNGRASYTSTHIFYSDINIELAVSDRIYFDSTYYQVQDIQRYYGIGGVMDHQECTLGVLDDL